jgi:hypothetical protein
VFLSLTQEIFCTLGVLVLSTDLARKTTKGKAHNVKAQSNYRNIDELEVCQLSWWWFSWGIEKFTLPRSPHWSPSQGPRSRSSNSVGSLWAFPMLKWVSMQTLPDRSPPSLVSNFWPKCHGPYCSLYAPPEASPQMWLVWSHKIPSPSQYKFGASKHGVARGMQNH